MLREVSTTVRRVVQEEVKEINECVQDLSKSESENDLMQYATVQNWLDQRCRTVTSADAATQRASSDSLITATAATVTRDPKLAERSTLVPRDSNCSIDIFLCRWIYSESK